MRALQPDGKGVDNLHLIAHDPGMPRYAITKNRESCGWKVGGEGGPPLRDDFASREDAKEYADDARATTYASKKYKNDGPLPILTAHKGLKDAHGHGTINPNLALFGHKALFLLSPKLLDDAHL